MTMHSGEPKSGPWLLRAGEHIEAAQPLTVPLGERYRNRVREMQEAHRALEEQRERAGIDESAVKDSIHAGAVKSGPWLLEASRPVSPLVRTADEDLVAPPAAQSAVAPDVNWPGVNEPEPDAEGHQPPMLTSIPREKFDDVLASKGVTYKKHLDNLESHFYGATEDQKKRGRVWYRAGGDILRDIGKKFKISTNRAIAMAAALSARTDWNDNLHFAAHMAGNYRPGENEDEWRRASIHPSALSRYMESKYNIVPGEKGPGDLTHPDHFTIKELKDLHKNGYMPRTKEDFNQLAEAHGGNHLQYIPGDEAKGVPGRWEDRPLRGFEALQTPEGRAEWLNNAQMPMRGGLRRSPDKWYSDGKRRKKTDPEPPPEWRKPYEDAIDAHMRHVQHSTSDYGYRPTSAYHGAGVPTLTNNVEKAKLLRTVGEDEFDQHLNGQKYRAFFSNLGNKLRFRPSDRPEDQGHYDLGGKHWTELDPELLRSTVDTQHMRAASQPHGSTAPVPGYTESSVVSEPQYEVYQQGLVDLTHRINSRLPRSRHLLPHQVQAIIWGKFKDDMNSRRNKKERSQSFQSPAMEGLQPFADRYSRRRTAAHVDPALLEPPLSDPYQTDSGHWWNSALDSWVRNHQHELSPPVHEDQRMGPHPLHEAAVEPNWYKDRAPAQEMPARPRVKPRRPNVPRRNHPYKMSYRWFDPRLLGASRWYESQWEPPGPSNWEPPAGWLQRGNQHRPGDIVRYRPTGDIGTVNHIDPDDPDTVHVDFSNDSPGSLVYRHGGGFSQDHHWSALEPIESADPTQLSELDLAYLDQISNNDPLIGNDRWIINSPNKEARKLLAKWYTAAPRKKTDEQQWHSNPNSSLTQLGTSTLATYLNALDHLNRAGAPEGDVLDYGAGRGMSALPPDGLRRDRRLRGIGAHTYEPFANPRTFVDPGTGSPGPEGEPASPMYDRPHQIPDGSYSRLMSHNVLNVLDPGDRPGERDHAVRDMGRVLAPGGQAVITARPPLSRGVDPANLIGDEPDAVWVRPHSEAEKRRQKGFTRDELHQYVQSVLGDGYAVSKLPGGIGGVGVHVVKGPAKRGRRSSRWLVEGPTDDEYLDCPHCKSRSLADEWDRGHCPVCSGFNHEDERHRRHGSWYRTADPDANLSAQVSPATPPQSLGTGHPGNAAQGFLQTVRNDAADMDLKGMNGRPYDYGGSGPGSTDAEGKPAYSWDCSGLAGQSLSTVSGQDRTGPPGDIALHDSQGKRFNTTSPMAGQGLVPGYSKGDLNLGVNPNPGEGGHTDVQTPSGLQGESKGSGIVVGPGAKPVQSFPQTWHLPNSGYPAGSSTGGPKSFEQMMLPPGATAPSGNKVGGNWYRTAVDAMGDDDKKKKSPSVNGNELGFGDWSGFGNAKDPSPANWGNLPAHSPSPAPSTSPTQSGGQVSYDTNSGAEQWRSQVELGLQRNGLPTSLENQVLKQIGTESSGNPNAINNWDSNAAAGHPSQGLLQTIPETFQRYHLPGDSMSITDPQANIDSAIGYAKSTYGPGLMSNGNGMGSGHGY